MFGTLSTLDDLEGVSATVAEFGEQALADRMATALAIHNQAMADAINDFALVTSASQLPYGANDQIVISELDQFGAPDTSKAAGGGNVGFPLRQYGAAVQWTRTWLQTNSVAALAAQVDAAADADRRNVIYQIQRTLFRNSNTSSYKDINQTLLTYDLKALLNADSTDIPAGPNGESFDGTAHTHYLGKTSLTAANLQSAIDTVVEHGVTGSVRVYIAKADEATVRGLTGFTAYIDARIQPGSGSDVAIGALDPNNPSNRAIGVFDGAEVWVKPWVPANYQVVVDTGVGNDKVVAIRTRTGALTGTGAFQIVADNEQYPLRARTLMREFGVSVYQRHKAAVMRSNNASYAVPTGF